jgi:hypothetical protein
MAKKAGWEIHYDIGEGKSQKMFGGRDYTREQIEEMATRAAKNFGWTVTEIVRTNGEKI